MAAISSQTLNKQLQPLAQTNFDHIKDIKSKFASIQDDFKQYYVFTHKNPEVPEYQQNFENCKSQLQALNVELFKIGQSIHSNIYDLNNKISAKSSMLEDEKKKNVRLSNILHDTENSENGAEILVNDTKTNYNYYYYLNVFVLVGILGVVGGIYRLNKVKHHQ